MSKPSYYLLYPETSKMLVADEMQDDYQFKIFPIMNNKIDLTKNELDDLLFLNGITRIKHNDDKSEPTHIKRPIKTLLTNKSIPELSRLAILVKKSQNVKILRRMRECDCIVLGKVENSNIIIYHDEQNNVPIFSSDEFVTAFLQQMNLSILLEDGYKPLKAQVMQLETLVGDKNINIWINPISVNPKVSFSLKLPPAVMDQIYQ